MKIYHFALIFILFFLVIVIKNDINIGKFKAMEHEKEELTTCIDSATADTINYLAKTGAYGTNSINKSEVVNTFLTSLYSSMGIISDLNAQTEIEMYIPVILICDVDGYYVYYYDEYSAGENGTYTNRKWSEKMPYYYKDDYFVYRFTLTDTVYLYDVNKLLSDSQEVLEMDYHEIQTEDTYENFRDSHSDCILLTDENYKLAKKSAIANQLEKVMAYYTSQYNKIAEQNGITYNFSFPSKNEDEWLPYMNDVNLLVVFQGYPYGVNHDYTYNKTACAGANVVKKEVYYVENKGWYYLAHNEGCPELAKSTMLLEEAFDSLADCAKMGAYCCDVCIKHGARVPDIE